MPVILEADQEKAGLMMKIDSLSLDELSKLWIALGAPLRLSVSLTVSSAKPPYDSQSHVPSGAATPQTNAVDTQHVTQLYQAVLKTFTEQSAGWKNRNMVVKQWVLQQFEKSTSMTVDEMLTALNSLGDKLEKHESTAQFIKPLNQLARYYKHQLDELRGMHKVSRNQTENLKTIETWIKDVESLVEALSSTRFEPKT